MTSGKTTILCPPLSAPASKMSKAVRIAITDQLDPPINPPEPQLPDDDIENGLTKACPTSPISNPSLGASNLPSSGRSSPMEVVSGRSSTTSATPLSNSAQFRSKMSKKPLKSALRISPRPGLKSPPPTPKNRIARPNNRTARRSKDTRNNHFDLAATMLGRGGLEIKDGKVGELVHCSRSSQLVSATPTVIHSLPFEL